MSQQILSPHEFSSLVGLSVGSASSYDLYIYITKLFLIFIHFFKKLYYK